ncbi:TniB family NTP-binding protein [Variovorax sp. W6]|uniref:TniB family NTP-binding protein n=1 Tax=Variovorax sp. W6 TaxID=3093895 RepID=UPI003D805663
MRVVEPEGIDDLTEYEIEDRRVLERRYRTYSISALRAALPIDEVFVAHAQFMRAVNAVSRVYELARETSMPQGMYLEGPVGTGKSSVLRYFKASLPKQTLFDDERRVITIRAKKNASAAQLVGAVLRCYGYPIRRVANDTLAPRVDVTKEAIRQKGTRLIGIDEASNLLHSPTRRLASAKGDGTSATDYICEVIDDTCIGVVLLGSERLASLEQTDPALASRLTTHERLENFFYDDEWVNFARAFLGQCTGFDLSFFLSGAGLKTLHRVVEGNVRTFKRFATECCLCTANEGAGVLLESHAAKAFRAVFGGASEHQCPYAHAS